LLAARDLLALLANRARWCRLRTPAALLMVTAVAYAEWAAARRVHPLGIGTWGYRFADGCRALEREVAGRKALVVSMEFSGAVRYYNALPPLRWDAMAPSDLTAVVERASAHAYAVYGIFLTQEVERARSQIAGTWTRLAALDGDVTIWSFRGPPGEIRP
jgi:hypothetical protein